MALVAKRPQEQGQISIFFSASLVVLVSIIAFVVNVGLFVKAKINLQNATDAAAYSGASVQARQLTKIAYLNWEMRNVYKEWMYKNYVIGNLNIADVKNASVGASGAMNFSMQADNDVITGTSTPDVYAFPSSCIHPFQAQSNICIRYAVPGLPEFGQTNIPGTDEASRALTNSLINTKVGNCLDRTTMNFFVSSTWVYNVVGSSIDNSSATNGVSILADRVGAWPNAIELAIRIRNLEYIVNKRTDENSSVCLSPGSVGDINCKKSINDVTGELDPGNERIVKAFYAGFRNVGGSHDDDEMKNSFTLTEIPPMIKPAGSRDDSSFLLLPNTYEKQYLDLKMMVANLAVFYSAMMPRADAAQSAACDVSKVAIPVPGYPFGFYKNPNIITYYAVKGEAVFAGMFNPFGEEIKLTTYSAAKPFGGRIGPALFVQDEGRLGFRGRQDTQKLRTVPYISALDMSGATRRDASGSRVPVTAFFPGSPLPVNTSSMKFWIENPDDVIGGNIADIQAMRYALPNLVYDYSTDSDFTPTGYTLNQEKLHVIQADPANAKPVGLFSKNQFAKFKGSLNVGSALTIDDMKWQVERVRAATRYDAANYMVPAPHDIGAIDSETSSLDSFPFISSPKVSSQNGLHIYQHEVWAPMYNEGDLKGTAYPNKDSMLAAVMNYMRQQKPGIDKYRDALYEAAASVVSQGDANMAASGARGGYIAAAAKIADIDDASKKLKGCNNLAAGFLWFFYGHPALFPNEYFNGGVNCNGTGGDKTLAGALSEYFGSRVPNSHYVFHYSFYPANFGGKTTNLFSAYTPGPFTGLSPDGSFSSPFPGGPGEDDNSELMRRNFYSTKFVSFDSLREVGNKQGYSTNNNVFSNVSEGQTNFPSELSANRFFNQLDGARIGVNLDSVKH